MHCTKGGTDDVVSTAARMDGKVLEPVQAAAATFDILTVSGPSSMRRVP